MQNNPTTNMGENGHVLMMRTQMHWSDSNLHGYGFTSLHMHIFGEQFYINIHSTSSVLKTKA